MTRELNPTTSSLTDGQASEYAETTGECSDGKPCGKPYCDDCPNTPHEADARRLDAMLAEDMEKYSVGATLDERGKRYGDFSEGAAIMQRLKSEAHGTEGWQRLNYAQREAIDMILHKIGRILNGDPDYADNWHDIAGYAQLVERTLTTKERK